MTRFRRRHFTLIELLVALTLTAGLLGTLLFTYRTTALARRDIDLLLWPMRERLALDERLQELFFNVALKDQWGHWFFTTPEHSLVFSYHNGVDIDPKFSGLVLGNLYVDSDQRLILATWPHPQRYQLPQPPFRQEVLQAGVSRLEVACYEPPFQRDPYLRPIDSTDPIQTGRSRQTMTPQKWHEDWPLQARENPALVRLTLHHSDETPATILTYALPGIKRIPNFWHRVGGRTE